MLRVIVAALRRPATSRAAGGAGAADERGPHRPAAHQPHPRSDVGAAAAGTTLDPTASGTGHRTPSAVALTVPQDRTTGVDQDPAAAMDARQQVRALVARERAGGPKVTAAEVIAATDRSRRRAYELLRDAHTPSKGDAAMDVRVIYRTCPACGRRFGQPDDPDRKRRFCFDACKQAAYRARKRASEQTRQRAEDDAHRRAREENTRRARDRTRRTPHRAHGAAMTPTAPAVPPITRRSGRWATGWSASCTVVWPDGSPTRSRSPGRPPRQWPEQRSGGCRGVQPPAILATRSPGGRRCRWGRAAARSRAMGRPGSLAAGSSAAEGGTAQPVRLAACLDRA